MSCARIGEWHVHWWESYMDSDRQITRGLMGEKYRYRRTKRGLYGQRILLPIVTQAGE